MSVDLSISSVLTSFIAGLVSFLSPCVLPLVPGYVSYVAGSSLRQFGDRSAPSPALRASLFFVLGFSTVFIILGASATAIGRALLSYRYEANLAGGMIVIVFGLLMGGLPRPMFMQREFRLHPNLSGGRPAGAYVLGVAFGFGWTPCIGPVLGAILTVSAVSATASHGIGLLGAYSLGLGVPFLLAALFTDTLMRQLRPLRRVGPWLQIGAGAVVVAMGIAMISGGLSSLSYWLLETFPWLARIG